MASEDASADATTRPAAVTDCGSSAPRPLLSISGLQKRFGGNTVLRNFNLTVNANSIMGLMGGNGAGKTTVFNIATGVLRPDAGEVRLDGKLLTGLPSWRISRLGLARTFQEVRIFEQMTVLENLQVAADVGPFSVRRARAVKESVDEVLELIGLTSIASVRAGDLSYAEQKFLSLGRGIVRNPKLLALDEPAAGLDDKARSDLIDLIKSRKSAGMATLLVEHNVEFLRSLVDELTFLSEGEIVAKGSPETVVNDPAVAKAFFGG